MRDYLLNVVRFWVDEFDIDGLRLDAADVLDFDFMRALRGLANGIKPEFWLMGEVIHGEYSRWVNGQTLHSVTDYALNKALWSGHNEHNYFEIAHTVNRSLRMARTEAALQQANPGQGINLIGLVKWLIPKKWRTKRSEERKRRHEQILEEY